MQAEDQLHIQDLKMQYELGGRLKFLKEKDSAFRTLLKFLDEEYSKYVSWLKQDETVREKKQINSFEPDNSLKGRIRMAEEFISFINTSIQKGESALEELQERQENP